MLSVSQITGILSSTLAAFATEGWQFWSLLALLPAAPAQQNGLGTLLNHEATRLGIGQGELQGMLSNLDTVQQVFTPFLWSSIYEAGKDRSAHAQVNQ